MLHPGLRKQSLPEKKNTVTTTTKKTPILLVRKTLKFC
jgi:hypothetical protein